MQIIQPTEHKVKQPRNKRNSGMKHSAAMAKEERMNQEKVISRKKKALEGALKCPPAIQQFKYKMDEETKDKIEEIFKRYTPETPEEKAKRIEEGREKQKVSLQFGIRQIVKLIEKKKAKLVLIANNVDPIVVVLFLPSLCKKMGVSYAIYDSKERLGAMVGRKAAACVAIEEVVPGLEPLISEVDEQFSMKYKETMKKWGKPARENK
ncbi:large subunit ribosomal protein L7Ae [Nematocida minor]|uniref:large subunit ribosomal protein L7Ae n=1 Tax=Nematocida minor TaxID=1912983 RepID=UPI00221FAB4A|nr:large subunit ribosomal protein L7Ae [Nematocida minor]KAI5189116.1 large subunit ribosomal protein L7Ae [Nematocida minor]